MVKSETLCNAETHVWNSKSETNNDFRPGDKWNTEKQDFATHYKLGFHSDWIKSVKAHGFQGAICHPCSLAMDSKWPFLGSQVLSDSLLEMVYNELNVLVQCMLWGCLTYVPVHNYTRTCNWNCILWNQTKLKQWKLIKLAVYKIKCSDCQASYIGETGRNLNTRLTEHKRAMRNGHANNHITVHHQLTNHNIDWTPLNA